MKSLYATQDEPQGNQVFYQMNKCIPEVVKAMRACMKETGVGKLCLANITADDPNEMIARGKYCLSQFGPLSENCVNLVQPSWRRRSLVWFGYGCSRGRMHDIIG